MLRELATVAAHALHDQKVAQHVPQVRMATRLSRPVPTRSKAPSRSQRHTLATAHGTRREDVHERERATAAEGVEEACADHKAEYPMGDYDITAD